MFGAFSLQTPPPRGGGELGVDAAGSWLHAGTGRGEPLKSHYAQKRRLTLESLRPADVSCRCGLLSCWFKAAKQTFTVQKFVKVLKESDKKKKKRKRSAAAGERCQPGFFLFRVCTRCRLLCKFLHKQAFNLKILQASLYFVFSPPSLPSLPRRFEPSVFCCL